ncbi:hypothetical protein A3767_19080 [Oleiphilus sp. HI0133]|nr:hypothetical protein A3767_19080 [Oleiphilus sp. HI0133]
MKEIGFLLLGWLLGLLSPLIVDYMRKKRMKQDLFLAIKTEAEDLQLRIAVTSFQLAQRHGDFSREYLIWLNSVLKGYSGSESVESIKSLVASLIIAPDEELDATKEHMLPETGSMLSLKTFRACLIENLGAELINYPAEYQRRIHEFKNQLHTMNQEIERAVVSGDRTFDSGLSSENHRLVKQDLELRYASIREMCDRVVDRLGGITKFDIKSI